MKALNQVETALKAFYLDVIREQINTRNIVLARIEKTSNDVWGKAIIVDDNITETSTIKELQNMYGKIELSNKAIRCCENQTGALVNLLNNECEDLIINCEKMQLDLLCNEIRKDCKLEVDNKEIINFLKENLDEARENIKLHQLCDWEWLQDESGKIIKNVAGKPLFVATLVKYGNFIIKQDFLNKIKERFKENENE